MKVNSGPFGQQRSMRLIAPTGRMWTSISMWFLMLEVAKKNTKRVKSLEPGLNTTTWRWWACMANSDATKDDFMLWSVVPLLHIRPKTALCCDPKPTWPIGCHRHADRGPRPATRPPSRSLSAQLPTGCPPRRRGHHIHGTDATAFAVRQTLTPLPDGFPLSMWNFPMEDSPSIGDDGYPHLWLTRGAIDGQITMTLFGKQGHSKPVPGLIRWGWSTSWLLAFVSTLHDLPSLIRDMAFCWRMKFVARSPPIFSRMNWSLLAPVEIFFNAMTGALSFN
jgi:hypothetical protein